jgi:hypothetical protein
MRYKLTVAIRSRRPRRQILTPTRVARPGLAGRRRLGGSPVGGTRVSRLTRHQTTLTPICVGELIRNGAAVLTIPFMAGSYKAMSCWHAVSLAGPAPGHAAG